VSGNREAEIPSRPRFSAWIKFQKARKLLEAKELCGAIGLSVYEEQTIVVTLELTMEATL